MNILWLSWRDIKNPAAGGAEKVAIETASRFVKRGIQVTIFTSSYLHAEPTENIRGVKIERRGNRLTCRFYAAYKFLRNKNNFDIVIDEINTLPFFTPLYTKKSIAFIHQLAKEYWFSQTPFPISIIGYMLEPIYLALYKNQPTITISESTKSDLKSLGFKNVSLMRVGLDKINLSESNPRQNLVLFMGRLTKTKGPQDAIEAFRIISEKMPDYKLIIVGRGEESYVKRLKARVKKLRIDKKVKFTGYITGKDKVNLLQKAKIILIPVIREGWNLVATEANATGCVPIGYNVPGLRDSIKNGKNGILVEKSHENLAQAAIDLLENGKKRSKLQKNGLKFAKNFNWDNTYKDFRDALRAFGPSTHSVNTQVFDSEVAQTRGGRTE